MVLVISKWPRSRGFTLLELLVALAIVGMLAAVAIPSYGHLQRRAVVQEGMLALLGYVSVQSRSKATVGHYLSVSELLALRPLTDRVAQYYDLQLLRGPPSPAFTLILNPREPDAGLERLSVDSVGRRHPDSVWF